LPIKFYINRSNRVALPRICGMGPTSIDAPVSRICSPGLASAPYPFAVGRLAVTSDSAMLCS
jgi:hypothetical protein